MEMNSLRKVVVQFVDSNILVYLFVWETFPFMLHEEGDPILIQQQSQ